PAAPAAAPTPAPAHPIIAQGGGESAQIFTTRCGACHGVAGLGDGPGAAALNPKPRSFQDPAWQDGIDDDTIKKTIIEGGAAVGKSPLMAPNPDLKDKPEVLDGIVKIIRGMKKT
ncbi:MAG: c-type cytochrome, partial [Myxococcales bacterium]|nr:c-type cytochrome [Myxococcales bacterium]